MSIIFAMPLAVQSVPDASSVAQVRASKIITRVPVAALWLLVSANFAFATIAIVLASLAYRTSSNDVHQVHTRLSIPGLAAALFDESSNDKNAKSSSKLFDENCTAALSQVKIGMESTLAGGMTWIVHAAGKRNSCVVPMQVDQNEQQRRSLIEVLPDSYQINLRTDPASVLPSSSQPTNSWSGVVLEDTRESFEGLESTVNTMTSTDSLQHDGVGQVLTHNGFDSMNAHPRQLTSDEPAIEAVSLHDRNSSVRDAQRV
jgi:hypothetical protein